MTTFTTDTTAPAIQVRSAVRLSKQRIWACITELRARRAQSAALRHLKGRDLRDIGLIDNDITAANNLPLSTNAATALHLTSLGRSGNW